MATTHEGTVTAYLYGAGAGAILVLAGLLWWRGNQLDHVRAEFTAYKAAQAQAVADATKAAQIKANAVGEHNAAVMADLQGKLDGSIADGTRLAVRLRLALAGIHTSPVPEAPGQPGTAAPGGVTGSDGTIEATAAAFAACQRDAARLDAWIAEVTPQL
jgi:hypothetical protein